MTNDDLSFYSCHSLRVWACVILHQAGKSPDYIKKHLRWLSEAYRVYLRDTDTAAAQHLDALGDYMLNENILPTDVTYKAEQDDDMGDYIDIL